MAKTQIIKRQINLRNEGEFVVCPYVKIFRQRPVISCTLNCDRYAGIEGGFLICGAIGANKPLHAIQERRYPSLWEVFGEGERNWMVGAYGKPKG